MLRCSAGFMLTLFASTTALVSPPRVVVLGGTGRIGSYAAAHLLGVCEKPIEVVLAGRDAERGASAVQEVRSMACALPSFERGSTVIYQGLDFQDGSALSKAVEGAAAVVHTAGPYAGEEPDVLKAAIAARVPVYVDLSDPVEYLDAAAALDEDAKAAGTLALSAAGAFPGLSNVLAMECAAQLGEPVHDLDFSYFTAGLGGSGEINLYITNEGFGEPVPVFRGGRYSPQMEAGGESRKVDFFLDESEPSYRQVGERSVWSWPFPEGCTVARQLRISGDSSVGMGTAPELWNVVLGAMVAAVPRGWWRVRGFSNGLAQFSKPLVALTDGFVGETHAMRVAAAARSGRRVSAVQAHRSFREVVGSSCAEFTAALLESRGLVERVGGGPDATLPASSGVFMPEALFEPASARQPLLERLLAIEGTLNWAFEVAEAGAGGKTTVSSALGKDLSV
jgi:saccharopine dehydrogenase-like NADP-dependent oxidoreductase